MKFKFKGGTDPDIKDRRSKFFWFMKIFRWRAAMNRVKPIVLVVLFLGVCQFNLFSLITSRVEGTVVDKDTGAPIEGVTITLHTRTPGGSYVRLGQRDTLTDKKGYFKFKINPKLTVFYFIECSKRGYVSFPPIYYLEYGKNEYYADLLQMFRVQEGEVKHLRVELEKGGTLKGTFYKKDLSGISPFSHASGLLIRESVPDMERLRDEGYFIVAHVEADENGKFVIEGIEPFDQYSITIFPFVYISQEIENIVVRKNQVEEIEYTFDMTDQTGIEGIVTVNGKSPLSGQISIIGLSEGPARTFGAGTTFIRDGGKYSYKGLPPGKYRLIIGGTEVNRNSFRKELYIELVQNETKVLNINI